MKTMRMLLLIFLLSSVEPVFAEYNPAPEIEHWTLAQSDSTFDPFIDYGEFQDNVTEEESIDFFQNGRSLTLAFHGGYEALTMNMRQIYGDAPLFGACISFFIDLRFAFQVSGAFPSGHYVSLLNNTSQLSHFGIDLKYYFNRQYLNKDADFFNPYVIFGPFWLNMKFQPPRRSASPRQIPINYNPPNQSQNQNPIQNDLSQLERQAVDSYNSAGLKAGLGIEFPFIKQSFLGFEASYLYSVLHYENKDLSNQTFPELKYNPNQTLIQSWLFPNRPQVKDHLFFGDLVNLVIILGLNF